MNAKDLEAKAEKALTYLHEGAIEHAQARANADHMADWCKVEKARISGLFAGLSAAAAESEALRHADYAKALEALKTAREVWFTAQFKREAANAFIQAWQTASANERRLP